MPNRPNWSCDENSYRLQPCNKLFVSNLLFITYIYDTQLFRPTSIQLHADFCQIQYFLVWQFFTRLSAYFHRSPIDCRSRCRTLPNQSVVVRQHLCLLNIKLRFTPWTKCHTEVQVQNTAQMLNKSLAVRQLLRLLTQIYTINTNAVKMYFSSTEYCVDNGSSSHETILQCCIKAHTIRLQHGRVRYKWQAAHKGAAAGKVL